MLMARRKLKLELLGVNCKFLVAHSNIVTLVMGDGMPGDVLQCQLVGVRVDDIFTCLHSSLI